MEQAFKLISFIYVVYSVVALIFFGTFIWFCKSKGSMPCLVTQLGIFIVSFALSILKLVLEIFLNLPYGFTIYVLCLFAIGIAFLSFFIRKDIRSKIDRGKKDNDKTNDDQ